MRGVWTNLLLVGLLISMHRLIDRIISTRNTASCSCNCNCVQPANFTNGTETFGGGTIDPDMLKSAEGGESDKTTDQMREEVDSRLAERLPFDQDEERQKQYDESVRDMERRYKDNPDSPEFRKKYVVEGYIAAWKKWRKEKGLDSQDADRDVF